MLPKTVLVALASTIALTTPTLARAAEYYTLDKGGCLPGDTVNKQPCCSGFHCKAAVQLNPNDPRIIARALIGPTGKVEPVLPGSKTGQQGPAKSSSQVKPGASTIPSGN